MPPVPCVPMAQDSSFQAYRTVSLFHVARYVVAPVLSCMRWSSSHLDHDTAPGVDRAGGDASSHVAAPSLDLELAEVEGIPIHELALRAHVDGISFSERPPATRVWVERSRFLWTKRSRRWIVRSPAFRPYPIGRGPCGTCKMLGEAQVGM